MVQIIQENKAPKRRSFTDRLGSGVVEGAQAGTRAYLENLLEKESETKAQSKLNFENQMLEKQLGIDLTGVTDPKIRQQIVKEFTSANTAAQRFGAQYKAKSDQDKQFLQELGLDQYFQPDKGRELRGQKAPQETTKVNEDNGEIEISLPTLVPDKVIYQASLANPNLAKSLRDTNKQILDEKLKNDAVAAKEKLHNEKLDYQSFKDNKGYTEKLTTGYEAYKVNEDILNGMEALIDKGELTGPTAIKFLDHFGIPLGILNNPDSEQFQKLSQELMKNISGTYGNRILALEVENFMKSIPTLLNSPEGQRRLVNQWKILNQPKKMYYDAYRKVKAKNPSRLPNDLHEQVIDEAEAGLSKLSQRFKLLLSIPKDYVRSPGQVLVYDPSTKNLDEIPLEQLKDALELGNEFIE